MKRFKHPRFGAIVTDSETIEFDFAWNGRNRHAPPAPPARLLKIAKVPVAKPRRVRHESRQRFDNMALVSRDQSLPALPPGDYEVRQPIRERQLMSEVGVPVLQSVVTGIFAAGGSLFIFGGIDWFVTKFVMHLAFITEAIRWFHWLALSAGVGWFVSALDWVDMRKRLDDLLYLVERMTGQDFNNDGFEGEPTAAPREVDVNYKNGQKPVELVGKKSAVSRQVWCEFATAVLCNGVLISKDAIRAHTSISQPDYLKIYGELADGGFLYKSGIHNQLNRSGFNYLSRYVGGKDITLPYPN